MVAAIVVVHGRLVPVHRVNVTELVLEWGPVALHHQARTGRARNRVLSSGACCRQTASPVASGPAGSRQAAAPGSRAR